jgi:hypothetical protein
MRATSRRAWMASKTADEGMTITSLGIAFKPGWIETPGMGPLDFHHDSSPCS